MNKYLNNIQAWIDARSSRDKLYLFISGFLFLYLYYFIFIEHPLSLQKNEIKTKIEALQRQQEALNQQFAFIEEAIKDPLLVSMIDDQKKLSGQLSRMNEAIVNLKPSLFSANDLTAFTKKILNKQYHDVVLISLNELPVEPWPPQKLTEKTPGEKPNALLQDITGVYQHTMQIEFQNDYMNTIEYLKSLENVSNLMYWDSMVYKVVEYPQAHVMVKFHVLSSQKS